MPYFQYQGPQGRPMRHPIGRHVTSIGSSPECHIVLAGADVMPTHCTLVHEPGKYLLESAERSAVFFVRGKKTRSHELRHGDVVTIGPHELVFSAVDDAVQPAASAPAQSSVDHL